MIAVLNRRTINDPVLRPLTPRSIVLSVLLGSHPPAMPVGRLVEFTSLFGIAAGTVRTAMSRMVAAGELQADDGVYRLAGPLLVRQAEQDAGRIEPPEAWDGSWWFAVVTAERRTATERREFRARALGARFGELRPDTWMRPANIDVPNDLADVILTRGPLLVGDPAHLVSQLWNLDELDDQASELATRLRAVATHLERSGDDAVLVDAFVTLAACQRFLRTEPQLPTDLVASRSSGDLRQDYTGTVDAFQRRLSEFFDRQGRSVAQ
jgi:phenylacetic acid degradation operon negative regulatory protein